MSDTNSVMRFLQQENTRLTEENKRLTVEVKALLDYVLTLDALDQATRKLTTERDLMSLMDKTLSYAISLLGASDGSLLVTDDETGDLVFVLAQGQVRELLPGYRIRRNEGIAGWVAQHGEPVVANDVRRDPRFSERVDQSFDFQTRSLVCVPLIARHKTLGVIEVVNKTRGDGFTDIHVNLLSILALVAAIALDDIVRSPEANAAQKITARI